jgi:hypothetical protein
MLSMAFKEKLSNLLVDSEARLGFLIKQQKLENTINYRATIVN